MDLKGNDNNEIKHPISKIRMQAKPTISIDFTTVVQV